MESRFETFTLLIAKINRSIHKIKTEEMAEFELKSPHVSCLYYLFKHGAITSKELCEVCDEDKAAISRSILFLQERGYIEQDKFDHKRYKNPLVLTEKGKQAGAKISTKIDGILNLSGLGLTEREMMTFYSALKRISDNLDNICSKY